MLDVLANSGGGSLAPAGISVLLLGVDRAIFAFFLVFAIGFASTFAYFSHVSLLIALCTCYILALDFADVLFMCAPAPVAYDISVRLIARVPWCLCLLCSLLLLTEHSTGRIHSCLPLVDIVLNLLHGARLHGARLHGARVSSYMLAMSAASNNVLM